MSIITNQYHSFPISYHHPIAGQIRDFFYLFILIIMNTHHNIQLVDLHKEDMDLLASQVSQRQSHEEFMNFLKEPHMTKEENLAIFNTKID